MDEAWRWFGPTDKVSLRDARQAGARQIVSALHHVPNGTPWPMEEIKRRQAEVCAAGMEWSVVESIPVTEDIKTRSGKWKDHTAAYQTSIRNLGECDIKTVCYNFMPVLDWTRTDLAYELPDGSLALRFDVVAVAAFDLFILKRPEAAGDWISSRVAAAESLFRSMSESERAALTQTMIAGLPGSEESYSLDLFRTSLQRYHDIGVDELRSNLKAFLDDILPVATESGVRLGIHPDDPPNPMLGLPRIMGTAADVRWLLQEFETEANGVTFCAGTFAVRTDNDVIQMMREFADRVHFVHLRNIRREQDQECFHESGHLQGDVDMISLIGEILAEERRRRIVERADHALPMRPDHGHVLLDDRLRVTNPGYSAIGRLKGLAELRGVMRALERYL